MQLSRIKDGQKRRSQNVAAQMWCNGGLSSPLGSIITGGDKNKPVIVQYQVLVISYDATAAHEWIHSPVGSAGKL